LDHKANVKVLRFDPSKNEKPKYRTYSSVPYAGLTILQVLKHIYENEDPTVSFRAGCDGVGPARCGACAMEVNGVPVLACQMLATQEMVIAPHRKFMVIKDLVVDFETERGDNG
jgi:succinate dehydrogenase/fumarate reductase-like Fe-S protein